MDRQTRAEGSGPVKTTDEARQGVTGHNVRYVLFWGIAGVIVVFVIAWFGFLR